MRQDLQAFLAQARGSAAQSKLCTLDELSARSSQLEPAGARFSFEALRGRLLELSGAGATAVLSAAVALVLEAQLAAEPVAWVTLQDSCFYPPDVVDSGVDISALAVVRVPDVVRAGRALEQLLRSGAFGLVVLDLGTPRSVIGSRAPRDAGDGHGMKEARRLSVASQGRVAGLAQQYQCVAVCITEKKDDQESMGSLVSLRADAARERDDGAFFITLRAIKDKRHGPGWSQRVRAIGPAGLK